MPVNDFEKEVQQKMDELRLRPSDEVWMAVAKELQQKKRRRFAVVFFLLAGLCLLGYLGYDRWSTSADTSGSVASAKQPGKTENSQPVNSQSVNTPSSSNTNDIDQTATSPSSNPVPSTPASSGTEKDNAVTATPVVTGNDNQQATTTAATNTKQAAQQSQKNKRSIPRSVQQDGWTGNTKNKDPRNKPVYKDPAAGGNPEELEIAVTSPGIGKKTTKTPAPGNTTIPDGSITKKGTDSVSSTDISQGGQANDTAAVVAKKDKPEDSLTQQPSVTKKTTPKTDKRIRWGVEGGAGVSGIRKDPLTFKAATAETSAAYDNLNNSPQLAARAPTYLPSAPQPGLGWRIGIVAEKKLSPRSTISAGLQYSQQTTKIKTGGYDNYNSFYRGEPDREYINRFHFISLPLQYQWQINKARASLPITWDAGITLSRMISTNGLVYNISSGGTYYQDKDMFNKTHVDLTTGFSLHVTSGKKWQWSIGPAAYFDLSRLHADSYHERQYLFMGGLRAKLLLPLKK